MTGVSYICACGKRLWTVKGLIVACPYCRVLAEVAGESGLSVKEIARYVQALGRAKWCVLLSS